MKAIGKLFARMFEASPTRESATYYEWDKLRSEALTPSHQAEIDAIFGRQTS